MKQYNVTKVLRKYGTEKTPYLDTFHPLIIITNLHLSVSVSF